MAKKRINIIWENMKQRCYNPNNTAFKYYGGKGVTVCEEWIHNSKAFRDWAMTHGYAENLTLDRIDRNGNYEPSNCRWVDMMAQANNKKNNHILTFRGKTQTIAQWSRETGISANLITVRINRQKRSPERALTEKPIIGKNQTYSKRSIDYVYL